MYFLKTNLMQDIFIARTGVTNKVTRVPLVDIGRGRTPDAPPLLGFGWIADHLMSLRRLNVRGSRAVWEGVGEIEADAAKALPRKMEEIAKASKYP